jgi:hypothetical protein
MLHATCGLQATPAEIVRGVLDLASPCCFAAEKTTGTFRLSIPIEFRALRWRFA